MSNAGQAVLSIGGAVVGFIVGGPAGAAWGYQIGSVAGQALFPTDLGTVYGPRLNDLAVQQSTVGAPIPVLWGTFAFSGNLIWSSGIIEKVTKKKQGGKGGPTQTVKTYSYSVNCAIGICEGVLSAVDKVWADAKLIYDLSPMRDTESQDEYDERIEASGKFIEQVQFYYGTEDQMPDPTIEAYEGEGNVQGFRGLAYMVITGFQLEDYGNRIPTFRVEARRCFESEEGLGVLWKSNTEVRAGTDGKSNDAELTFPTTAGSLYWIPGVLYAETQVNNAGAPGFAVAYDLPGGVQLVNSKEGRQGSFASPSSTSSGASNEFRAASQFSDAYGTVVYGGGVAGLVHRYFTDIIFRANDDDVFSVKWGGSDNTASGEMGLTNDSRISVRELHAMRGWGASFLAADTEGGDSLTPQPIDGLVAPLDAGGVYLVRGTLFLRMSEVNDAKIGLNVYNGSVARAGGICTSYTPVFSDSDTVVHSTAGGNEVGGSLTPDNLQGLRTRSLAGEGDFDDKWTFYEFETVIEISDDAAGGDLKVILSKANVTAVSRTPELLAGSSFVWRKLNGVLSNDVKWVQKQVDESRTDRTAPLEDDAELFLDLDAGQDYWIDALIVVYTRYDYGNRVMCALDYSGTAERYEAKMDKHWTTYQTGWAKGYYEASFHNPSGLGDEVQTASEYDTSNSSLRGTVRWRGWIRTTTAGRLSIKWRRSSNSDSGPAVKVFAGSFLIAHDLNMPLGVGDCTVTVGDIVDDVCNRCGLSDSQIDVSELTEEIDGYVIGKVTSGRSVIEPLRSFSFFDCVESGTQLKWPKRGKAAVATLIESDLAAFVEGSTKPPMMKTERKQPIELPRRLRIHYAQKDQNYEMGEQSASRLTAGSEEVRDIELPIAMSASKAAKIADVLLYDLWVSQNTHSFTTDHTFLRLESADAVIAPIDGRNERLRILDIDLMLPGLLTINATRDDDGVYVSYAIGSAPAYAGTGGGSVATPGEADLLLLDLPLLRDEDDDAGYYAAVDAVGSTAYGGAVLYRSPDGGITYDDQATLLLEASTGTLVDALPAGPTTVVDWENTLTITSDEEFESIAFASLLAGLNSAAIGADGRWEIIQFMEATFIESPESWELRGLLRGRRGTEWAVGTSQVGDRFVLLDSALERVSSSIASIGLSRKHKVVLQGEIIEDSDEVDFATDAVALMPFSPVDAQGEYDMSGDLTITWKRRGRIGQELPSGTDIPLSEESEEYEIDIIDESASPDTVVRTISTTDESATYTFAQQTTDFGTSIPAQFLIRIYQLSAAVGRGYPLETYV